LGVNVKGKFLKVEFAKKESPVSALVVESEPDSEYSRPKSIPTIKIATEVEGVSLPSSLADCGAMINIISEDKVIEHNIPTHPMPPMLIHEPLNPHSTCVHQKVVSKVRSPQENWESRGATEFVVAPLMEYDAILGMPFLAEEGILVDPAHSRIVLPAAEAPPIPSKEEPELGDGEVEGIADLDNLEEGLEGEIAEELAVELDSKDGMELLGAEFPSICPKVKTSRKFVPPQPDLGWIQDLEEFEKSKSAELREYIAKFTGTFPSDPELHNEYFIKLNEYFIK